MGSLKTSLGACYTVASRNGGVQGCGTLRRLRRRLWRRLWRRLRRRLRPPQFFLQTSWFNFPTSWFYQNPHSFFYRQVGSDSQFNFATCYCTLYQNNIPPKYFKIYSCYHRFAVGRFVKIIFMQNPNIVLHNMILLGIIVSFITLIPMATQAAPFFPCVLR